MASPDQGCARCDGLGLTGLHGLGPGLGSGLAGWIGLGFGGLPLFPLDLASVGFWLRLGLIQV